MDEALEDEADVIKRMLGTDLFTNDKLAKLHFTVLLCQITSRITIDDVERLENKIT